MKRRMAGPRRAAWSVLVVAGLVSLALPARADAIDGEWCFKDGRRMSIRGPDIVTPGGTRMQGDYDRHGFAYVVPTGESGAGAQVFMVLLNEDTVYLWLGTPVPPRDEKGVEVWHRCQDKTS